MAVPGFLALLGAFRYPDMVLNVSGQPAHQFLVLMMLGFYYNKDLDDTSAYLSFLR